MHHNSLSSKRLTLLEESADDALPLLAEEIGSREGSVTSADDEAVDAFLDEVVGGLLATLLGADWRAAGE